MKAVSDVKREFDAIARAGAARPDPAGLYDSFLLSLVPRNCTRVLEIGCGTGRFTRQLAREADHVTAIDLSGEMIRVARQRNTTQSLDFIEGDALEIAPQLGTFDCAITLATFHHLPQEEGASMLRRAVRPGGVVILHDLWRNDGLLERAIDAVRLPYKVVRLLQLGAPLRYSRDERAAWQTHERDDVHLTRRELHVLRDRCFPGAALHEHFLWRYTLVWGDEPIGQAS